MNEQTGSDLVRFAKMIWRRRLILVVLIVVSVVSSEVIDQVRTKRYAATATLQLLSQNITQYGQTIPLTPLDIASAIPVVTGNVVSATVAAHFGFTPPIPTVSEVGATELLALSATSTKPTEAVAIANEYVTAYIKYTENRFQTHIQGEEAVLRKQANALNDSIMQVSTQISALPKTANSSPLTSLLQQYETQLATVESSLGQIELQASSISVGAVSVSPASLSTLSVTPKKFTDAALAGILGMLLAVGLIFLFELWDDRIRDGTDLRKVAGDLPILGEIPLFDEWEGQSQNSVIVSALPSSPSAEAYRGLRTAVQFLTFDTDSTQVIQITSPLQGEGKTTTVIDLAATMGISGARVVLISCDLRRPSLHKYFPSDNRLGLSTVLEGTHSLEDVIVTSTEFPTVSCVPSGPVPPNPSELLASSKMVELIDQLRNQFDYVIIDSPALLPITDSIILAQLVDIVLVLVRAKQTQARALKVTLGKLASVSAPVRGVILNGGTLRADGYGLYGRKSGYAYYQN